MTLWMKLTHLETGDDCLDGAIDSWMRANPYETSLPDELLAYINRNAKYLQIGGTKYKRSNYRDRDLPQYRLGNNGEIVRTDEIFFC